MSVNPTLLDDTDVTKTTYVEENSMIRGFYISMRLFKESGTQDSGSSVMYLRKAEATSSIPPATPAAPSIGQVNSLGTINFRNRIFHIEQAIVGSQVSGLPMGFPSVKIPRRFHAMKRGDYWLFGIGNNTTDNIRACGIFLYKWYR